MLQKLKLLLCTLSQLCIKILGCHMDRWIVRLVIWYLICIRIKCVFCILPKFLWKLHASTIRSQKSNFVICVYCKYFQHFEGTLTLRHTKTVSTFLLGNKHKETGILIYKIQKGLRSPFKRQVTENVSRRRRLKLLYICLSNHLVYMHYRSQWTIQELYKAGCWYTECSKLSLWRMRWSRGYKSGL